LQARAHYRYQSRNRGVEQQIKEIDKLNVVINNLEDLFGAQGGTEKAVEA
jgi:hypothetical protein